MSIKKFFRVTPEEHRLIAFNAAAAGLEESSYLRVQALGKSQVRQARHVRADWDELRCCLGVVNKAGNVINQFVMELRLRGSIQAAGMAQTALNELIAAARAIVAALREL
jgi:hypothetical protein